MAKNQNDKKLFEVKPYEQYRTVNELIERGRSNEMYYTLLVLSSFIIAAGLLLNNAAIVIGGMLVTPVLTPVLLISLAISVGDIKYVQQTLMFVGKSFLVVVIASFILGLVFETNGIQGVFLLDNSLRGAVLYFIVALASGLAATFAWVRRELTEILPGIAIAIALVPPLSLIGIGLSGLDADVMRFNFFVFFFNFLGVLVGSNLVFSLLKFHRVEKKVEEAVEKQEKEKEATQNKKSNTLTR